MMSSANKRYYGLVNQGATCYLNSVLQVLFMTEDFRDAVKRHCCNSDPKLFDLELNSLFDNLQSYAACTYNITEKLGIDNVYEQRDAAEYFEKILGLTSHEASQIFHGQQTQKTICSTCSAETGSDTPFWNLTLALVNSCWGDYSVVDGIEEYFRDSYFSGENQMYCDVCEAKSDATTKCEIKDHPEVLMLLLKRFEFDYRYMTYVKINCAVNVPLTLQITENQTYELYAVVDHFGDLRSGHYNSTIKSQNRWYLFNDESITMPNYQPFQVDSYERSSSAYLLFYRKKRVHAAETCTQDPKEMSSSGDVPPATTDVYSEPFKAEERREREEDDRADYAEQIIHRNEKTEIIDLVPVGSSGEGLASDDQDKSNHQDCEKDKNDLSYNAEKLRDEVKMMTEDEEDKRGDAQAHNQTVRRGSSSGETQPEESVDDPNDDSVRTEDVRHSRPQEGLGVEDMHNMKQKQEVSNVHHQQVSVDINGDDEERKAKRGKLLTIHNLNVDDIQAKGVGKSKQSRPEDDQKFESRPYQRHEQPREQERYVKGDKQPKRRDDEHAQIKGASERRERDQKGRSEHVTVQKEDGAVKQARGGNELIQRADSSLRKVDSAGSSRVRGNRGDGRVAKSEPSKAIAGLSEDTMEGKRSSKHSKPAYGKIIEEEIHSGGKKSIETKIIRIKTVEERSRGSVKSVEYDVGDAEIESEPKTGTTGTLSDGVHNLQLNNSALTKPWKCRKEKNETKSTSGKVKKKRKHTQCFYFCRQKRQTSESD